MSVCQHDLGVCMFRLGAWVSEQVPALSPATAAAYWKWSCLPVPYLLFLCPRLFLLTQLDEGELPFSLESGSLEIRALVITTVNTFVEWLLPHASDHLIT